MKIVYNIKLLLTSIKKKDDRQNTDTQQSTFSPRVFVCLATLCMLLSSQYISTATPLPRYNIFRGTASITPIIIQEKQCETLHTTVSPTAPMAEDGPIVRGKFNSTVVTSENVGSTNLASLEPEAASTQYSLVRLARGQVSIATIDGDISLQRLRDVALQSFAIQQSPLYANMFSGEPGPFGEIPLLYGEVVDESGAPKRWQWETGSDLGDMIKECKIDRNPSANSILRLIRKVDVPFTFSNYRAQAAKYNYQIELYADKYKLSKALILAVMHTESNFNPFAISRSNALGLMQVVPETAGEEAHRYLTGTRAVPSSHTLLTPEHNIRYGVTYLHILAKNYFGDIVNPSSRQICMIAAYNGGPGAVLRTFDSNREIAVAKINALPSDEVYRVLTTQMPTAESRRYIDVVLSHYRNYVSQEVLLTQTKVDGKKAS